MRLKINCRLLVSLLEGILFCLYVKHVYNIFIAFISFQVLFECIMKDKKKIRYNLNYCSFILLIYKAREDIDSEILNRPYSGRQCICKFWQSRSLKNTREMIDRDWLQQDYRRLLRDGLSLHSTLHGTNRSWSQSSTNISRPEKRKHIFHVLDSVTP